LNHSSWAPINRDCGRNGYGDEGGGVAGRGEKD
jgi:hypothetical protein